MEIMMKKRVAIVTGASSGIGAATARRLFQSCDGLVLQARKSAEALEAIAEEGRAAGVEVLTLMGDLTEASFGKRLVEQTYEMFGRLDCVVANAGFPIIKSFEKGTHDDLEYAFKGNAISFFGLAKAAAPLLARSGSGRIVAVGSFTSHVFRTDIRNYPLSAASKGALEVTVKSLALEFAKHGVTVNCVIPGCIQKDHMEDSVSDEELLEQTKRIPLGRAGLPADVASAINYLLTDEAGYITGQSIHVNGGLFI